MELTVKDQLELMLRTVIKEWDDYKLSKYLEELEKMEMERSAMAVMLEVERKPKFTPEEYKVYTATQGIVKARIYNLSGEYRKAIGQLSNMAMEQATEKEHIDQVIEAIQENFNPPAGNSTLKEIYDNTINSLNVHKEWRLS